MMRENTIQIRIDFEITEAKREALREALRARAKELGIGMPTFLANLVRKLKAYGHLVVQIDGRPINTDNLTARDLGNFLNGTRMTAEKLVVLDAYFEVIEMEKRQSLN